MKVMDRNKMNIVMTKYCGKGELFLVKITQKNMLVSFPRAWEMQIKHFRMQILLDYVPFYIKHKGYLGIFWGLLSSCKYYNSSFWCVIPVWQNLSQKAQKTLADCVPRNSTLLNCYWRIGSFLRALEKIVIIKTNHLFSRKSLQYWQY